MTEFVKGAVRAAGYSILKKTPDSEILDLLSRIRPVDCGRDLIRIGGEADGGYLVPADLQGVEYCFSPGVSTIAEFENHLADLGICSFLADYSVPAAPVKRPEIVFVKKFLGAFSSDTYISLPEWVETSVGSGAEDLLLQMDIEGSEYEVIFNAPQSLLSRFRMLIIEFHGLDSLFSAFGFQIISRCFDKLLQNFHVVHAHPNNCCGNTGQGLLNLPRVLEMTLYNRARVAETNLPALALPHKLDRENIGQGLPTSLPACWLASETGERQTRTL